MSGNPISSHSEQAKTLDTAIIERLGNPDCLLGEIGKIFKKATGELYDSIYYSVETWLLENLQDNIRGTAERMARAYITDILNGDEKLALDLFGRSGIPEIFDERRHISISYKPDAVELRSALVAAHKEILAGLVNEDREVEIVALREEIRRLHELIERGRQ